MIVQIILWFIFVGTAIVLSVVILLQESKGGGLAEAFGGMGAQTFGVKASGINRFTAYVAIVFLLSAVLITCMRKSDTLFEESKEQPVIPPAGDGAPAEPGVLNQPGGRDTDGGGTGGESDSSGEGAGG